MSEASPDGSSLSSSLPLASALLSHAAAAAVAVATTAATPELERHLTEIVAASRAAWPGVDTDTAHFMRHLAERLPAGATTALTALTGLAALHAPDLWLACACLHGVPAAFAAFERAILVEVRPFIARIDAAGSFVDEVCQILRERLLVGTPEVRAKIADYSGTGALVSWVRVAAIRTALSIRRSQKLHGVADDEVNADLLSPGPDPEIDYIKTRYRAEFQDAFATALASLTSQQRNLLRLHFLDDLNIDKIGALHRVHRSTVARWLASARETLLDATRRHLHERLRLTPTEFDSLMGLVRSQLHLSLKGTLG